MLAVENHFFNPVQKAYEKNIKSYYVDTNGGYEFYSVVEFWMVYFLPNLRDYK